MFIHFSVCLKKKARDKSKIITTCKYHVLPVLSALQLLLKQTLTLWEHTGDVDSPWSSPHLTLIANSTHSALRGETKQINKKAGRKMPHLIVNVEIKNCPFSYIMVKRQHCYTKHGTWLRIYPRNSMWPREVTFPADGTNRVGMGIPEAPEGQNSRNWNCHWNYSPDPRPYMLNLTGQLPDKIED